MNKALLLFLLTIPCFSQTFSGNAGGDLFVPGPFRFCFGADDGKSTCFTRSGNNEVKTVGALDYQLAQRTVAKLPNATLNAGRIYLVTDGISSSDCTVGLGAIPVFCASNGSAWMGLANLGGGGGGGGGSVGSFSPGCIVSGAPAGSAVPLVCSSLIDNGATVRTNEAILAPVITGSTANGGIDMTTGTGAAIQPLSGHSDLFADSTQNGGIHAIYNGVDTGSWLALNPSGNVYHIDGLLFPGGANAICNFVQNAIPSGTTALVYVDVLTTNETCNPFAQGVTLNLYLSSQNTAYTTNVPWILSTHEGLRGIIPGTIGTTVTGTTLQASSAYVSQFLLNPPSGFTLGTTTSCSGSPIPNGTYWAGLTWSGNQTNETQEGQQQQVTFSGGNQCLSVTSPGSAAGVSVYNIYICNTAGCGQGAESWKKQSPIANNQTIIGSQLVAGTGNPPAYNNTGAIITMGGNSPASSTPLFGIRVENLYIDCNNVAGAIAGANLQGEEHSGFFNSEAKNCPGNFGFLYEGYSLGTGASNSQGFNLAVDTGNTSNPTVAGIGFDQIAPFRGFDTITVTGGNFTTLGIANGTISGGAAILTSVSNPFTNGMVGQGISVPGAGINGVTFTSTILSFQNSGQVTLSSNAVTSVTTANPTVYPTPYCMLINDVVSGPPGGTGIYNPHFEKCANGLHTIDSQVEVHNATCSPNVAHCIDFDALSTPAEVHNVRQGTPGITIYDASINYTSPRSFEGSYSNNVIQYTFRDVGPTPSCTSTDLGTGGTCLLQAGSVNTAGRMLLTMGSSSGNPIMQITLTYGSAAGLGDDNSSCSFFPVSGAQSWLDNTTWRGTSGTGTGATVIRIINGGGAGTAFTTGQTVGIEYICRGY